MGRTVLVTGGSALLGRYIVETLLDEGQAALSYTDTLSDLPRLLRIMGEGGVRHVVHTADASDPQSSVEMPVATVMANVGALLNLLEAARLARVRGRIVLLSSAAVYGHHSDPIDESTALHPRNPYAVTKVTGEQLGTTYADLYGLDVVVLRLGDVYGPALTPPTVIESILTAAVKGATFRSATGSDQTFHLTHGDDVARAVLAALNAPAPEQRIYNITGGERHTLGQIAGLVRDRFPYSPVDIGPGALPELDRQGALDIRAADRELGYRPLWGLARGLDDYAEWLVAQSEAA